ncbi:hypothetical protein M9194_02095 [Vibrio sp. S4M6]|uniref:hypothetical protein n=1 Tax=Vibrio sinus TaxID=2946865 RepID=UPI002029E8D0|nr:hypothetical protein [Vibrio sinus]MCL9780221.1 hypothetical protein [Vibrio sinus]
MFEDTSQDRARLMLLWAIGLSLFGEFVLWVVYGLVLYPGYPITTLIWAATCGLAMGSTMGALSYLLLSKLKLGRVAFFSGFAISAFVLSVCNVVCFVFAKQFALWGALASPINFLGGGFVGVLIGSVFYSWLLFSRSGNNFRHRLFGLFV